MLHLQNIILEMVATGRPLTDTMDRLCREVERDLPGIICSVLRVDTNDVLHTLSAPSLPAGYSSAIDGLSIGPNVGSCGTAAYYGVPITVKDVAKDPKWADFHQWLVPVGLRACWSSPICDGRGRVLGTFGFYFREQRGPTKQEEEVVAACLHLCMIALERHERVLERDRLANEDVLTGLSNRACFNAVLAGMSCRTPGVWGILVVDLDHLKVTNDTFGHDAGDALLQEVALRITRAAAPDTAFRLGGDEFAVIVQCPDALRNIEAVAQRILASLDEPVCCDGHLINAQATIGGATLSPADMSAEAVRQKADFALYHAKETGRGGFVRYWPGIGTAITKRLSAIRDVNAALRENRIEAYYQPVVHLETGQIVGAEALCRLITPEGEVISAADFCEATTDAHVACALTERMLSQIVVDVRRWLDLGVPFERVGLNVSYADIHRGKLPELLSDTFSRWNVPLKHLVVEITENVYIGRRDHVIAREFKALRKLGFRVALDDFGTGFASLTHLLSVPVDVIKIDKSFVANIEPGTPSAVIVEGLMTIARKLGIDVVAEGVERLSQVTQLRGFGCTLGQGYLFSKAVPRDIMTELLLRSPQKRASSTVSGEGAGLHATEAQSLMHADEMLLAGKASQNPVAMDAPARPNTPRQAYR